ncbi:acyl-CoA N-acyltransferase [Suillus clintonianus]|uniref:acyl-CoA N-acyltransferase n=1 Tax=Suillus clintonianus TaxID=1904413 RepID=UPI001B866E47|nr:acyl-CoA N-acyltransferase [Suillus clintonianus]KAG2156307.1 acyl-CoA N-acyltransferase [Suillus clintonianus]
MEDDAALRVPPTHEIIIVPPPEHHGRHALLQQCIQVRIDVFVTEQRFPLEVEVDEHDPEATHWLLRLTPSNKPIGTIRAHKVEHTSGAYYKLARLVVLKEYRHYKFGRNLVLALHNWAKDNARNSGVIDFVKIVCHSQAARADSAGAVAFYRKLGYEEEGNLFEEDGEPHQKMVARLSLSE